MGSAGGVFAPCSSLWTVDGILFGLIGMGMGITCHLHSTAQYVLAFTGMIQLGCCSDAVVSFYANAFLSGCGVQGWLCCHGTLPCR